MRLFFFGIGLVVILSTSFISTAFDRQSTVQESCGTDKYYQEELKRHPELREQERALNQRVWQRTKSFLSKSGQKTENAVHTIPVVFHVIHNGGSKNISNDTIQAALKLLNDTYRNIAGTSVDIGIAFALAKRDSDGNCTDGVTRTISDMTYHFSDDTKSLSDWPNTMYLNIWTTYQIGDDPDTYGYATFPWTVKPGSIKDGVAIRADKVNTTTLAHEIGHWLGLYHTFQDGCSSDQTNATGVIAADNCGLTGDKVCDTPPQTQYWECAAGANTCSNDSPNAADDVTNLMGYADCRDHFTADQNTRIGLVTTDVSYAAIREALWSSSNLSSTGVDPASTCAPTPVADFYTPIVRPFSGHKVAFYDESYRDAVTGWLWEFEGGSPASSTEKNPTVSYDATGAYDVCLAVTGTNGNDRICKADYVQVIKDTGEPIVHIYGGAKSSGLFARTDSGRAFAWGYNRGYVSLGIGEGFDTKVRNPVEIPLEGIQEIASNDTCTLFLTADDAVYASGFNDSGALGVDGLDKSATPVRIDALAGAEIKGVYVGGGAKPASFALDAAGQVWAWGNNDYYQLGDGTTVSRWEPRIIDKDNNMQDLPPMQAIAANDFTVFALDTTGQLWGWGQNGSSYNLLQTYPTFTVPRPVKITGMANVRFMAVFAYSIIVSKTDNTVWCWGDNSYGICAEDPKTTPWIKIPVEIPPLRGKSTVSLRAGGQSAYLLDADRNVWTWGVNHDGQLGITDSYEDVYTPIKTIASIDTIFAGNTHNMAMQEQEICVVGNNYFGQFGNGHESPENSPAYDCTVGHALRVQLEPDAYLEAPIRQVDAGAGFGVLVAEDGHLWTWGQNTDGQLGLGTLVTTNRPQMVTAIEGVRQAAAGDNYTLVLKSDGTVWGWGGNELGQLGTGTKTDSVLPVQAQGVKQVVSLATRHENSLALDVNGTVWQWGSISGSIVPVAITGLPPMQAIAAGYAMGNIGLDRSGKVWTWTYPTYPKSVVSGLTGITSIAAGQDYMLALSSNGTVYAWGKNGFGQLGDGTTIDRLTPAPVKTLGNVAAIYAAYNHSFAVTKNGKIYGWGRGQEGQLGEGSASNHLEPVEISVGKTGDGVVKLAGGISHSIALLRNEEGAYQACASGNNNTGQLGDGVSTPSTIFTCAINFYLDELQDNDKDAYYPPQDCDDWDPAIYPGIRELNDKIDNDCDGLIDENYDNDGDGTCETTAQEQGGCYDGTAPVDCDDTNASVSPGESEVAGDSIDNNCNGEVDEPTSCSDPQIQAAFAAKLQPILTAIPSVSARQGMSALEKRQESAIAKVLSKDVSLQGRGLILLGDWKAAVGKKNAAISPLLASTAAWLHDLNSKLKSDELVWFETFLAKQKEPALTLEVFSKRLEVFFAERVQKNGVYLFGVKLW